MQRAKLERLLAVTLANGEIAIMQVFSKADPATEIGRSVLPSPPVSYVEVTPEQADAIRAARPRPSPPPAAIVGDGVTPELAQAILDMAGKLASLEQQVATHHAALTGIGTAAAEEARQGQP